MAYNPLSAQMAQNPYPSYANLRARDPVHRSQLLNAWVFTRYADVDTILRDYRHFSSDPRNGELSRQRRAALPAPDDYAMLFLDPPDHTRLRALVNKAFTPRAINALEPHIRSLVGTLLDDVGDPASFDLMEALAHPLPVIVIAEMLGVPPEDRAQFRVWSNRRARLLEPTISAQEREVAAAATEALDAYFRPIIKQRRAAPQDDIVSALAHAEEQGDTLTEREMLTMLRLLLVAGNETTTNLIGNGMLALLQHPDQFAKLRDDPSAIPTAVEELLRFDSPVQTDFRYALADCEVNGFPVRRGQNIVLLLGAANRDPGMFGNPDRLDVGRREGNHLSFGRGIHHCLGAPLARLEGRIVLETLLERFSSLRLLTDRPQFRDSIVLRGLRSLPVCCVRA
ncbi:MAG: cytochrome P450 [Truepera sp.]|nr:cytochrome P450 [Truepera sp.]